MDSGSNELISSILSNPESLKMIMGIAKNLLTNNPQGTNTDENYSATTELQGENNSGVSNTVTSNSNMPSISPDAITSIIKLLGASNQNKTSNLSENSDPSRYDIPKNSSQNSEEVSASAVIIPHSRNSFDDRANLLKSIKPYLKTEKQEKVDSLVKALNVAKLINTYTDSGGFSDKKS